MLFTQSLSSLSHGHYPQICLETFQLANSERIGKIQNTKKQFCPKKKNICKNLKNHLRIKERHVTVRTCHVRDSETVSGHGLLALWNSHAENTRDERADPLSWIGLMWRARCFDGNALCWSEWVIPAPLRHSNCLLQTNVHILQTKQAYMNNVILTEDVSHDVYVLTVYVMTMLEKEINPQRQV